MKLSEDGVLSLSEAVAKVTCNAANILGIAAGTLTVGANADLCIVAPNTQWELTSQSMISQGKNTPFLGWQFSHKVTHTFINGKIVYQMGVP